jgi:hypothetical protein
VRGFFFKRALTASRSARYWLIVGLMLFARSFEPLAQRLFFSPGSGLVAMFGVPVVVLSIIGLPGGPVLPPMV